jgi:putative acetyltransferase
MAFNPIRIATPADLPELAQLYRQTVLTIAPQKYSPEQVQAWADAPNNYDYFYQFIFDATTYIWEDETGIVGFSGLQSNGHITSLYIRHDRVRQGIGKYLLLEIMAEAKQQGLSRLYSEASEFSVGLFLKMGFNIFGTEHTYYGVVKFYRYLVEYKQLS